MSRGARVHVAYLPSADGGKVGVDDFLLSHTVADLEQLLTAPRRPPPTSAQTISTLKLTKDGQPRPIVFNILEILTRDARWAGVFGFDELDQRETLRQRPPYLTDIGPWDTRPVRDADDTETSSWLQREYDVYAATSVVAEAIHTLARRAPYHPIRDYLTGLTWDNTPRLDTFLSVYCHAEDTPYTRAVGVKTLVGAVARVMQPGCKADCALILQGEQGELKSTAWRILASDRWFSDTLPEVDSKDAAVSLQGKWIVELGDLAALQRSALEAVKRFISANQDHYRPPYGRRAETFPRHNIFVGSTNRETYFKDETGNRRYWPVSIEGACDIAALTRDRDQLWAEAYTRYHEGEAWHLTAAQEALAAVEQEARVEADPWDELIMDYAQRELDAGAPYITTKDIMVRGLGMDTPALYTQQHTKRIGAVLRRQRWRSTPVWITLAGGKKKQIKAWKAPDVTPVTAQEGEDAQTGNSISANKINDITDVTDVTDDLKSLGEESRKEEKRIMSTLSLPFIEDASNRGNASNTGNSASRAQAASGLIPVATNGTRASETSAALTAHEHAAADWLRGRLADGPESDVLVEHDAEKAGISARTLKRVFDALQVRATKEHNGWYWRLPSFGPWECSPGMEEEDDDERPF
jgi:predicted P-loop ATPase